MSMLPAMLNVRGRRCLVVGGGAVALRRAQALRAAQADVCVVAPRIDARIETLGVQVCRRPYQSGDVRGTMLVVIASDDAKVNRQAADDAAAAGALVNRADQADQGDVSIPAHGRCGPITLAVHTGGISAAAAARIRDQLQQSLDENWVRLLETIAPFRDLAQQRIVDGPRRRAVLARLGDDQALRTLKEHGPAALVERCRRLLGEES